MAKHNKQSQTPGATGASAIVEEPKDLKTQLAEIQAARAPGRGAKQDDVAALKARIAELEAQAGARDADERGEIQRYPAVKYRKAAKVTPRWPNGYEAHRVNSEAEELALGEGWYDSPADVPGASV